MKKLAFFPVIGLLTLVLAGCYHYYPTITVRASGGPKAVLEHPSAEHGSEDFGLLTSVVLVSTSEIMS